MFFHVCQHFDQLKTAPSGRPAPSLRDHRAALGGSPGDRWGCWFRTGFYHIYITILGYTAYININIYIYIYIYKHKHICVYITICMYIYIYYIWWLYIIWYNGYEYWLCWLHMVILKYEPSIGLYVDSGIVRISMGWLIGRRKILHIRLFSNLYTYTNLETHSNQP